MSAMKLRRSSVCHILCPNQQCSKGRMATYPQILCCVRLHYLSQVSLQGLHDALHRQSLHQLSLALCTCKLASLRKLF